VRVRPELSARAPSDLFGEPVSVGEAVARYKPGIPTAELLATHPRDFPGVDFTGVMFHIGRHGADPGLWAEAIGSLARIVAALREAWDGWEPAEIDVGGGFPLPRDPTGRTLARRADAPAPPPLERYAEAIGARWSASCARRGSTRPGARSRSSPGGRSTATRAAPHPRARDQARGRAHVDREPTARRRSCPTGCWSTTAGRSCAPRAPALPPAGWPTWWGAAARST
jgi:hypothetical protein